MQHEGTTVGRGRDDTQLHFGVPRVLGAAARRRAADGQQPAMVRTPQGQPERAAGRRTVTMILTARTATQF